MVINSERASITMPRAHHVNTIRNNRVSLLIIILIPSLVSVGLFMPKPNGSKDPIPDYEIPPITAGTNDGQQVIDYFRTVFESDWSRGLEYDQVEDDIGFPQSREIYGSGYTPFPSQSLSHTSRGLLQVVETPRYLGGNLVKAPGTAYANFTVLTVKFGCRQRTEGSS